MRWRNLLCMKIHAQEKSVRQQQECRETAGEVWHCRSSRKLRVEGGMILLDLLWWL